MNQSELTRRFAARFASASTRRPPHLLARLAALLPASACAIAAAQPGAALPVVALAADGHAIRAEVARTSDERTHGLMLRKHVDVDAGMLFVFGDPQVQCFWMHDTLIPLSVAFIADDGRIVNVVDMAPRTETSHCSTRPVRFVLEMNQSWFAQHGIAAGGFVTGEPFTR